VKDTGKGIPIAAISSAQLMLETLGEDKAASFIEAGVIKVLREDIKDVAAGKMGFSTKEVGDLVVEYIEKNF
jgi:3-isopropylmalate dehydrogenase